MDIVIVFILFGIFLLSLVNTIITMQIAGFLPNMASSLNNKLDDVINEPPSGAQKTERVISDKGLLDVKEVQTYDPRFIDEEYTENQS
jgi:hypothetical protein